jgi:hypothetical protein
MRTSTIRLLGEEFQHLRFIDPCTRLTMLAEGTVEKVYKAKDGSLSVDPALGQSDFSVKIRTRLSSEIGSDLPSSDESKTYLTRGDMERNAFGMIDTPKKSIVYKLRKQERPDGTFPDIPASIRRFGRDAEDKPRSAIVGNEVDRSMSKVEAWFAASAEGARAVTIACGRTIGVTERSIGQASTFVL